MPNADEYRVALTFFNGIEGSNVTSPLDLAKATNMKVVPTGEGEYARGSSSWANAEHQVNNKMKAESRGSERTSSCREMNPALHIGQEWIDPGASTTRHSALGPVANANACYRKSTAPVKRMKWS